MDSLERLSLEITSCLQNGFALKDLRDLVLQYNGSDWKNFCKFSHYKYKKNLIFVNNLIEVYIVCWEKNQESGIHNHPDNGCLVKILEGSLIEREYDTTIKQRFDSSTNEKVAFEGDVSYQEGSIVLHSIINQNIKTVTLHIYSPPGFITKFF